MAQPRPSLTLIIDIDERHDSEEVRLELNRCYSHVGSVLVRTHPAGEGAPENVLRFLVKMGTRSYLDAGEEADALWGDVMERWFYNELHKVGNNMLIYNRRQREIGNPELVFDWIDIDLQNGALHALLHCDNVSGIDPEAASQLSVLRAARNGGLLGEGAVRALMPAPASYAEQAAAGLAARAEREAARAAERAAAEAEARAAREAAEARAEESFLESPELAAAQDEAPAAEENADAEDRFALDEPDFAVDYRLWLIEYADGTARTFDSAAGELA